MSKEKIIKYDNERKKLWREIDKLEQDKKNLIKQVKAKHEELEYLKAQMSKIMEIIKRGIEL